ncbi:unnamed protein product [Durusdinium trenchii]|uniref:Helicase ATP-binding domain-containing protein n=1 Tax=Durusdinium trenchii TaxID=1381693 RepID=A0ABP0IA32_9DINO
MQVCSFSSIYPNSVVHPEVKSTFRDCTVFTPRGFLFFDLAFARFKRAFLPYDPDAVEAAGGVERVSARRKALGISIENPAGEDTTAPPLQKLTELPLPNWLAEAIRWEQLDEAATASAIQAQLLPIVLAGENAILVSEAKSGAEAFVYLMLASLQVSDQDPLTEEEPGPIALVLADTQDTSASIADAAKKLFQYSDGETTGVKRAANLSGGGSRAEKLREMTGEGAHLVVGTPKRIHDLATKYQVSLLRVTLLVLDGLDYMEPEALRELSSWIRPERQTLMFCNSWTPELHELAGELCLAGGLPVKVTVKPAG